MTPKSRQNQYVYAVCVKGQWGRYKIGRSADPARRLADMQVAHSQELVLIRRYKTANAQRDEKRMHHMLQTCRLRGEWYECKIGVVDMAWRQVQAATRDKRSLVGDDDIDVKTLESLAADYPVASWNA